METLIYFKIERDSPLPVSQTFEPVKFLCFILTKAKREREREVCKPGIHEVYFLAFSILTPSNSLVESEPAAAAAISFPACSLLFC